MNTFLQIIAIALAGICALMSIPVIIRLRQPTSPVWWAVKVFASAPVPLFIIAGGLSVLLGIVTGSLWICLVGGYSILFFLIYVYRVNASITKSTTGFNQAFGNEWESCISQDQKTNFLPTATALRLPFVSDSAFRLEQNISFCALPGTNRQLLCDVWQPSKHNERSGIAFIYFHGSAWCVLDKDYGTRPFFRHLVAQGHVIMDVAYRLFPETDMKGMVNDVYRAIAWMKSNAVVYGINPDSIVIGGASAGAHLSLLAAYACHDQKYIPEELKYMDLSVGAVISLYGPTDLEAVYFHCRQHIASREKQSRLKKEESASVPQWVQRMMDKNFQRLKLNAEPALLPEILGCHPNECPEMYASFSPISYVHKDCPPTLIMQGEHDIITPTASAKKMFKLLKDAGVPVVMYLLPQTDHAFDLVLPRISPVAHTAFYTIERFMALLVKNENKMAEQKTFRQLVVENAIKK
jgi:acetyl esterase/lipase